MEMYLSMMVLDTSCFKLETKEENSIQYGIFKFLLVFPYKFVKLSLVNFTLIGQINRCFGKGRKATIKFHMV